MNFTKNMTDIEQILQNIGNERLPLEDSLLLFERGVNLIRECQKFLTEAEQKVTILTEDNEELSIDPDNSIE